VAGAVGGGMPPWPPAAAGGPPLAGSRGCRDLARGRHSEAGAARLATNPRASPTAQESATKHIHFKLRLLTIMRRHTHLTYLSLMPLPLVTAKSCLARSSASVCSLLEMAAATCSSGATAVALRELKELAAVEARPVDAAQPMAGGPRRGGRGAAQQPAAAGGGVGRVRRGPWGFRAEVWRRRCL
jgi:hypothetical protein